MSRLFNNQSFISPVLKHRDLPVFIAKEFNFYRCVEFNDSFYGKMVTELHRGNLRNSYDDNRYASLFPDRKISYWADNPYTAKDEIKKHGKGNNVLIFCAYDDASSFSPMLGVDEPLVIADGRSIGFAEILAKSERGDILSSDENGLLDRIIAEELDCLAYNSCVNPTSTNYIFFEKGFNKLALKEVKLRLGDMPGKNRKCIACATTSDYTPCLENYGKMFLPLARTKMNECYLDSDEYIERQQNYKRGRGVFV
jgi:hypothetical protein